MTYIDYVHITDEDLVRLYLATRDKGYFGELYRRFSPKVYAKCITILKSKERAEDATQDIFVKVALKISNFRLDSRFSTWIYSITYHYCIDELRKSKKQQPIENIALLESDINLIEVDDRFLLEIELNRLADILNEIPINDKIILMMKYMDEVSIKELAAIMDKSESAIKMKLKRAKMKFKKIYIHKYHN